MEPQPNAPRPALTTIQLDAPLSEAIDLMNERSIRHLPVLDGDQLVGILSERDLTVIETLMRPELGTVRVAEAMTPDPYVASDSAKLSEVVQAMAAHKYGCVLITDASGALTDIFTANDGLLLLADAAADRSMADALRDKLRLAR